MCVRKFDELAPSYLETVRQLLVSEIGEGFVLDKGVKVYTGLDLKKQIAAQEQVQAGLRVLDKRQGYRGPLKNITESTQVAEFLLEVRNKTMDEASPERILKPDGTFSPRGLLISPVKMRKAQTSLLSPRTFRRARSSKAL